MGKRNPIAQQVTRIRPQVVPDKREAQRHVIQNRELVVFDENWREISHVAPGAHNED